MRNKNRSAAYAGFALFACFGLLYAAGTIQDALYRQPLTGMLLSTALAFFVPAVLLAAVLRHGGDVTGLRFGFPGFRFKKIGLAVNGGIAVSLLAVLLNTLYVSASDLVGIELTISLVAAESLQQSFGLTVLGVAVVPALLEEIFLHGVLQPIYEQVAGTWAAILFTAVVYAMLHGDLSDFIGPLLTGCLYGYLTYECQSVWPAFIAHLSNNLLYLGILWLIDTYAAFGIWEYFSFTSVILLLLFLYLTFRTVEDLLEDDEMPHFQRRRLPVSRTVMAMALNPGFLVFAMAFMAKAVFQVI